MNSSSSEASASSRLFEAVGDLHATNDRLKEIRRLLRRMGYRPSRAFTGDGATGETLRGGISPVSRGVASPVACRHN